jgi:putative hydrolase of the HAD superfamily
VLLDAAGVIALPNRGLVRDALAGAGITIDPASVPGAHYRAARALDRSPPEHDVADTYLPALCAALGVGSGQLAGAVRALARRARSGERLWSEPGPDATAVIAALTAGGIAVLVVTNSDGHAAENLRDAGICQTGPGPGASVSAVVDSALVGSAKPDPGIFRAALRAAGVAPSEAVHVGDRVSTDVAGALAAGIVPIHLDPYRGCRDSGHRHVRSLRGIWRHVAAPGGSGNRSGSRHVVVPSAAVPASIAPSPARRTSASRKAR